MDFYEAVRRGKLDEVKRRLDGDNALLGNRFTRFEENAVHVAVVAGQEKIVSELLGRIGDLELLEKRNSYGETALTLAAARGKMRIVKMLVEKYESLVEVKNTQGRLPVVVAALYGHKAIVHYLYSYTLLENLLVGEKESNQAKKQTGYEQNYNFKLESKDLTQVSSSLDNEAISYGYSSKNNLFVLFKACITTDIALEVFKACPEQCIEEMKEEKAPLEYEKKYMDNHQPARTLLRAISKELLSLNEYHTKTIATVLGKPMLMAILEENVDFVAVIIKDCPDMLRIEIDGLTLFSYAISKGLRKIYKFACTRPETGLLATVLPDRDGNTILHQAAKLSLSQSLGPAIKMQIELQRFKEVEKMAPMCRTVVNNMNQTPKDLFIIEHKELKKNARDWWKDIATSFSVMATLVVTIMFAAAFTVPGGYKEDTGIPINLQSKYFTAYIISDAFSLFLSCTSAMIFLGIHTSLFREDDFKDNLLLALISGLLTLFLSITMMFVTFGAALVIMLGERFVWIPIPVLMLGSLPVCIYVRLHVGIFMQVLRLAFLNPTN
ncbi:ankyrin repeat-containing protein NPR4-like [Diospyros lotus]|uniref:ankyrin repeat-containing protein NPR4-like n=1 Tax=Diospyros lotus TaxID=55363 RepID=UPI0022565311|nr:ankyrin repeat-containing protein NPR4-like [Diospyros lotus]